jgi:hypothetical protein
MDNNGQNLKPTNIQYWLAELDQYGNPTLIDGAHSDAQGANRAAYLITALKLGISNRRFAVARIELSECKPSAAGVNLEAVSRALLIVRDMVCTDTDNGHTGSNGRGYCKEQ